MVEVSVLMPVFNTAAYLEDAIRSVLEQEGPEFELLACDDGSSDGSRELLERFADHPRVRIFANERNLGQGGTRNRLAREARGAYLVPCDSDDLLLPGNLREHLAVLRAHPDQAAVYSGILVLRFTPEGLLSEAPSVLSRDYRDYWDLQENAINHGGCMIDKALFLQAGGYEADMRVADDYGLWLRLVDLAPVYYHRDFVGYVWRRHPAQCTQRLPEVVEQDRLALVARTLKRRAGKSVAWGAGEPSGSDPPGSDPA